MKTINERTNAAPANTSATQRASFGAALDGKIAVAKTGPREPWTVIGDGAAARKNLGILRPKSGNLGIVAACRAWID